MPIEIESVKQISSFGIVNINYKLSQNNLISSGGIAMRLKLII